MTKKQPEDQDQDFEKRLSRRLETKTQVLRTTTLVLLAGGTIFQRSLNYK